MKKDRRINHRLGRSKSGGITEGAQEGTPGSDRAAKGNKEAGQRGSTFGDR